MDSTTGAEAVIEIRNILVTRNNRPVLDVAALDIKHGETLAIVGPNGSGKSTLLLALAYLLPTARGDILFNGKPLKQWGELEYRRKISFVFQSPLLLDMTVEQNIALGLTFRGMSKEETHERVDRRIKQLGIESLSKRRASQLSGGEAQRVSLARALVLDPELLLLDEPFAALDPPTRKNLIGELSALLAEDQRMAVFVTHNLNEAAKLSQRIAVIIDGRVRQVGTAMQIKSEPADETVRAFLQDLSQ
ncbi:MAG TPA: ATP-binding cassette domain-containing protein [Anaerolineales bacterium]|nr:ATP-binding cassette domain-containing protein [Anaerolineales bacterium]